eukprot:5178878-Prymnesium_polylepis.1
MGRPKLSSAQSQPSIKSRPSRASLIDTLTELGSSLARRRFGLVVHRDPPLHESYLARRTIGL